MSGDSKSTPSHAFMDGTIVPWSEAKVHISTHALHYGTGCYEGIKSYWHADESQLFIFRGRDHYKRIKNSCKILFMQIPYNIDELMDITKKLLRANETSGDSYIRPVAFKKAHKGIIGADLINASDGFFILAFPLTRYHSKDVLHLGSSSWRRIKDAVIPARGKINGLYVNNSLARSEAMLNGYDDALMMTEEGFVSEGATSNIVIIRDGILITPPPYMDILEGITLDTVTNIARHLKMQIEFRPIHRSEVYIADEVFLCGTASEVKAVTKVDHRVIGGGLVGPITRKIREMFRRILLGQEPDFMEWLEAVY